MMETDRQQLIRVYLEYRAKRNSIKLLDDDIQAVYEKNIEFWIKYYDRSTRYISLVNEILKAQCMQKQKHCKNSCRMAVENIFTCEYCNYNVI